MPTRYVLSESATTAAAFERRKEPRRMVFNVAAELRASELASPLMCTVRDVSESGARLEIDRDNSRALQDAPLPESVEIYFCTESKLLPSRVCWQDGRHFGVEFIDRKWDDAEKAPASVG